MSRECISTDLFVENILNPGVGDLLSLFGDQFFVHKQEPVCVSEWVRE